MNSNQIEVLNEIVGLENQAASVEKDFQSQIEKSQAKEEASLILQLQQKREQEQMDKVKAQEVTYRKQSEYHSKPLTTKEFIERRMEDLRSKVPSETPMDAPNVDILASPSIYLDSKGETFLANTLGTRDTDKTLFINDFILSNMDIEALDDTPDGYNRVLTRLLGRIGLDNTYRKDFIINKLYLYLTGRDKYAEDNLVLSIMKNKTRHRYKGR